MKTMSEIFNPIISIEFIYTNKCNLKCAHCISNCGPEKNSKLDSNKVIFLLKHLPEYKINSFGITGGEPILFLDEITKILSAGKKYCIKSKLISNGFWGVTKENAEKVVSELASAGLMTLNISTDEFHQKFIPEQYVLNISDASKEYKKKHEKFEFLLRISFGKNYSVLDFIAKNKNYFTKLKKKEPPFFVFSQFLLPIGRAFENIQKENYEFSRKTFKGKCVFLGRPAINHDGKFLACCNSFELEDVAFNLKNFNSSSPKELIESYSKSLFVFYLRTKGPHYIIKLAEKNNLPEINKTKKLTEKYVGLCDYCILNLSRYSRKDLNDLLLKEFNKDKKMQELARKQSKKDRLKQNSVKSKC